MAEKRADYFAAGTQVVWDVDPLAETIAVYRADAPTQPGSSTVAATRPRRSLPCPAWRSPVADLFPA